MLCWSLYADEHEAADDLSGHRDFHKADYRARGGYTALEKALTQMTPWQVTAEVTTSGIQGRGGAAFPAGCK